MVTWPWTNTIRASSCVLWCVWLALCFTPFISPCTSKLVTTSAKHHAGYVIVVVCLFVSNSAQKLPNAVARKFQGRLAMGWWTNDYILAAIRITVWIQGLFSGFVTTGRYGTWLTDTNLLLILICQMAALAIRALEEVYTAPVLLVFRNGAALTNKAVVSRFGKVALLVKKSQQTNRFRKQQIEYAAIVGELNVRYFDSFFHVLLLPCHTTCMSLMTVISSYRIYASVNARHSRSGRQPNCGAQQRSPPIFGRATITLGIGPHF